MTDDNARITSLTTDAIRATGEKMIGEIKRQVQQVDEMAEGIRELAKNYEAEIGVRTLELTDHITAYTALGAKTTEMFRMMSEAMKPLKENGHTLETPRIVEVPGPMTPRDLDDLKKIALHAVERK